MSNKTTVQEWHDALDVSTSYATEDDVLPILGELKFCLQYCALFPPSFTLESVRGWNQADELVGGALNGRDREWRLGEERGGGGGDVEKRVVAR
ncbi:hypothetical protein YC2023_018830 [Brassica napus]